MIYIALEKNFASVYLIDSIESFNIVQDGVVEAALLYLLAALLRLIQSFFRSRVAEILSATIPQIMKVVGLGNP